METPRKFIIARIKFIIARNLLLHHVNLLFIIAIINLRGVSAKLNKYIVFTMQTYKKLIKELKCLTFAV